MQTKELRALEKGVKDGFLSRSYLAAAKEEFKKDLMRRCLTRGILLEKVKKSLSKSN